MVALAASAAVVGIGASSVLSAQRQTQKTTVRVTAVDFGFKLSTKRAPHGVTVFVLKNTGNTAHDFSIAGKKTKRIGKGQTASVTVTLSKGKHPYKCTVPGHATLGMKGTFTST
jgi:plastocyanin